MNSQLTGALRTEGQSVVYLQSLELLVMMGSPRERFSSIKLDKVFKRMYVKARLYT